MGFSLASPPRVAASSPRYWRLPSDWRLPRSDDSNFSSHSSETDGSDPDADWRADFDEHDGLVATAWTELVAALRRDPALLTIVLVCLGGALALFVAFPFPTTIHLFLPFAIGLCCWVALTWCRLGATVAASLSRGASIPRTGTVQLVFLAAATALVFYWGSLGLVPTPEAVPDIGSLGGTAPPRYFIAANLYNNERIFASWSEQVSKLVQHLGPENTFVSIYESNSVDATPQLLERFAADLSELGAGHRIVSERTDRWWPYDTSPERIRFLAEARNRALEPLQSADAKRRLPDHDTFTKIVFINDIVFTWQAAVRLLATSSDGTPGEDSYDLACGMDYAISGLYDTWVARDVCGAPLRIFWPYVKDAVTAEQLRNDQVIEVSACWNGIVAFPAAPYLYRAPLEDKPQHSLNKRGWKMVDNSTYPGSRPSPALDHPLQFRTSGVEACDHSECFLFSYDLHRLYDDPARPPRILMNPAVKTAYNVRWWRWNNYVTELPIVKWWIYHWSHGVPFKALDVFTSWIGRRRDYCTWAKLTNNAPARCPPLAGAVHRSWEE